MRVTLTTTGGIAYFPGLARPVTIESNMLAVAQAQDLARRVAAVDFFNRPVDAAPPPSGAADYHTYILTVEDGSRTHTVRLTDLTPDLALLDLLHYVQSLLPTGSGP